MSLMHNFLCELYTFLVGKVDINNNIIRKHTRNLEELGDLSFPLEIKNWYHLLDDTRENETTNIFRCSSTKDDVDLSVLTLIEASKEWPLTILKCAVIKESLHLWLERTQTIKTVIEAVHEQKEKYGCSVIKFDNTFCIQTNAPSTDLNKIDLTELKLILLQKVIKNLLKLNNCTYKSTQTCERFVMITNKSSLNSGDIKILCGAVLDEKGSKNNLINASEFYRKQTINMRLMAEHKYGVRVTAKPGWQEFFEKLGEAAVIIDLLQNKPHHTTTVNLSDNSTTKSKGAAFILYNCARLAALFKEFDKKVSAKVYLPLPDINEVDYSLLVQPEEWELLYVHILQFPLLVQSTIKDIERGRVNPHYLVSMLSKLSSLFSVYYRRVRILTEPRQHLFPILHARIHLLKAVEQVFHNGLRLLDIQPVKQM